MRLTRLQDLAIGEAIPDGLIYWGPGGEQLRVDALEQDVFRVRYLADGGVRLGRTWMITDEGGTVPREGRQREDMGRFSGGGVVDAGGRVLRTDTLAVAVDDRTGGLSWSVGGVMFAADLPRRGYVRDRAGTGVYHYMQLRDDACFYGFGERAGGLNKRGYRMEMRNLDAFGYSARNSDPLYKHFPVYIAYLPELEIAYGMVYDNLATTVFDMGREIDAIWGPFVSYYAANGDVDYYLLYGPTIEAVVEKIGWLTGYPFLPPRWTLGYLGSTMSYTDSPDAQEQLKQFAELTRQHAIPCDGFHLSSGYTTDADGNRNVFTWNRDRIPEPSEMVARFHEADIHLMANVKPYILEMNPHYGACATGGYFVGDADTGEPFVDRFWSGGAYESAKGAYLDFTSAAGYGWWQAQLQRQLFGYGVDVIWNDNNEYAIWDDAVVCDGFGAAFSIGLGGRPLQTLLMAHASYRATMAHAPGLRPFVLSRSGCPGVQRYAQTWSGDNSTSWETLKYNIPMGLGMGLSGAPNTGHDVGGFHGPRPEPELFVRWVQNGIFHPRFTIHSWNTDGTVNEPWMYPAMLPFIREALQFRYRLLPYLYSLFHEAHRTGHPIIRPTVYHYADDRMTHDQSFEFMLGRWLLVASVLEPGARIREVYLPGGVGWYDFHTGFLYDGGQSITVEAPLDRVPLFVPAGGMIPMGPPMRHTGDEPDRWRRLCVFPGVAGTTTAITWYEDDGISRDGPVALVEVTMVCVGGRIRLGVDVDESGYRLPYRELTVVLPPGEGREVVVEGFSYDEEGTIDRRVVTVQL